MSTAPAAGWYPDPQDQRQYRWWNGVAWSHETHPIQQAQAAAQPVMGGGQATGHASDPRYAHDRYVVRQKVRPLVNKYEVHAAQPGGDKHPANGALVAFVQEKRVSMRGKVTFYGDANKAHETLSFIGDKKLNIKGSYTLTDPSTGEVIGQMKRRFGASIFLKSTWELRDPQGTLIAVATESKMWLAILRRYGPEIFHVFPYSFTIATEAGYHLGSYVRRWGLRDTYDLDLTPDTGHAIDRRLAVAMAVGLDALESR